jgi:hypothetical protein
MAFLPTVKSIRREDIGPEAPGWVDNLLAPLTTFMESIYSALNKQLTFQENIACTIRDFQFSTSSTYNTGDFTAINFPSGLRTKPIGCMILQITNTTDASVITSAVSLAWEDLSGNIKINYVSGLTNSRQYNMRLLVC